MRMKTSTPNFSPLKKHSLNKNFVAIEDDEDLEREIQKRREEAINKSAEVRRRSAAVPLIAGLTATELNQHCRDCIKLSTENKINTKNAFSFLLIDAMAAMAKKADSEISKNFQVASCTLDASVKIYGYRVDAVHTDTVKMAGGVLSKEVEKESAPREGEEEDNVEEEEEDRAKKKRRRRKHTIAAPETLNGKSESEFLVDVTPHQSFLLRKTDGNDLLIRIPKLNDDNVLYINSEYPCWPSAADAKTKREEVFDPGELLSMLRDVEITQNDHFCSTYRGLRFGGTNEDSESESSEPSPRKVNCFEFDMNASVEDVPMCEEEEEKDVSSARKRLEIPAGGYESDQEIRLPAREEKPRKRVPIADLKNRITLDPLEYSVFDAKALKSWAGPSYWKVLPERSRRSTEDAKESDASKAAASKRTRKGRVKPSVGIFEAEESELVKHFKRGEKTTLNQSTMLNWSIQNVTVPKDCLYTTKNFFTLFHLPEIRFRLKEQGDRLEVEDASEEDEELEYCSMRDDNRGEEDEEEEEEEEEGEGEGEEGPPVAEENWDEKNMVAAPNRVEKIHVSAFKRKKNVDMKQLKKCLWGMLTDAGEKVSKAVSFSEIMDMYDAKMPNHLTPCLSAPLIFNALLHLTNEKCLVLAHNESNKHDFVVSQ